MNKYYTHSVFSLTQYLLPNTHWFLKQLRGGAMVAQTVCRLCCVLHDCG